MKSATDDCLIALQLKQTQIPFKERSKMKSTIPIDQIDDFPNHPFKVRIDEDMNNLVRSIKEVGVLIPIIVRQKENGRFEIVSGHRRKKACELAGIKEIPVDVRELSDDEAIICMVDSNLDRSVVLPSEKAFSYKMRLEAIKRQGKRTDLTSGPLGQKLNQTSSRDEIAETSADSSRQISRYIRLTELIPELLEKVDDEQIALRPAVELSYLSPDEQLILLDSISYSDATPSHYQAIRMRDLSRRGLLTQDEIENIMGEEKPNQKTKISVKYDEAKRYLPQNITEREMSDYVLNALKHYHQYLQRKHSRDSR